MTSRDFIESLETRRLLAGVTVLTHGFAFSAGLPNWLVTMESALSTKMGGANIYRMGITNTTTPFVSSFTKVATGASTNAESIVTINWSAVANVIFNPSIGADDIAALAAPYLRNAQNLAGDPVTTRAFAELPIHLVGHSRGGSLVADLARKLADSGIWVDQLTLLDPVPVNPPDPAMSVADNVVFSDNYFQSNSSPSGSAVAGSRSKNLTGVSGVGHSAIHSYYHGTIARTATTDGDGIAITGSWYAGARAIEGYDKSRMGVGSRWPEGVSSLDGGVATRVHLNVTAAEVWDNVGSLGLVGGTNGIFTNGEAFNLNYRYQDSNGGSSVSFHLDNDTNPYNGFAQTLGTQTNLAATGATPNSSAGSLAGSWSSAGLSHGVYHLVAKIESQRARYAYMTQPAYVHPGGVTLLTKQWNNEIGNQSFAEAGNWKPGNAPVSSDNVFVGTGTAQLAASQSLNAIVVGGSANLTLAANGNRFVATTQLLMSSSAKLNLNDNDMIIDYAGASALSDAQMLIASARNNGDWDGNGITSTSAGTANPAITTLGAMESAEYLSIYGPSATFAGQSIDATAVLIKYTWYGDADFSGSVDFDDYVRIDGGFNSQSSGWENGDFNFDGIIDFDDYVLIDSAFNNQSGVL